MKVPVLETERLILREQRRDDYDDCHATWSDPEVTRYIGGKPSTAEESWTRLLRLAGHWELMGYGYWVAIEKATGAWVGQVGFGDFKRELTPSISGHPEIGWVLARSAHGKGYATESARAALAWRDRCLPGKRTVCLISSGNKPSIRVAEKLGFHEFARSLYHGEASLLLERFSS